MNSGRDRARRTGFTIIEVMLFLAISGFLLVGILAGTGTGIARQRYNDSVQNVARILREQYSAVINTQIPMRESDGTCLNPNVDDLLSGGRITGGALGNFFDASGNLIEGDNGRGRTSCLVYGMMVTIGSNNGEVIQTSSLIGRDIEALRRADTSGRDFDAMTDMELLRLAGVNNLGVYYDVTSSSGGAITGWQCWVRTAGSSASFNIQWGARMETTARADNTLMATLLIIRSPKDGAIRTYVMDSAIMFRGSVVDYAEINNRNGGKGWGLQDENSGACNGTISTTAGGYQLLRDAGINQHLNDSTFRRVSSVRSWENDAQAQNGLIICVGSNDIFALAGQRRMIGVSGGHNASAVELVDMDSDSGANRCL
jgi:type II secretory pathway pseudopilin PulG